MKKITGFFLAVCCLCSFTEPGNDLFIPVRVIFGDQQVETGGTYQLTSRNDSLQLESIKFYLSGIRLYKNEQLVFSEIASYHLVDISDPESCVLKVHDARNIDYDCIELQLGLDSNTNVSQRWDGDLDPTKGMYWSWQTGYIHFKLEGKSALCATRNHTFQFHLGGYSAANKTLQKLRFEKVPANPVITLNLEEFFAGIDLSSQNTVMIPGSESVSLFHCLAGLFSMEEK